MNRAAGHERIGKKRELLTPLFVRHAVGVMDELQSRLHQAKALGPSVRPGEERTRRLLQYAFDAEDIHERSQGRCRVVGLRSVAALFAACW